VLRRTGRSVLNTLKRTLELRCQPEDPPTLLVDVRVELFSDQPSPPAPKGKKQRATFGCRKGKKQRDTLGFRKDDAPLAEEMRQGVASGLYRNAHVAAQKVVGRAVGGGTEESKIKRLLGRYAELSRSEVPPRLND
jgi:hypothetical protein